MRPSTFRRVGATLLLALLLPSCTDTAPTTPELSPDEPAAAKTTRVVDASGRKHDLKVDSQGGYVTRVHHDIDGRPFARLVYHYRAAAGGGYALEKVSGRVTWAGRTIDVGAVWSQIEAASAARKVRPSLLSPDPRAATLALACYWELAELAAWSAGLAAVLGMSPVLWGEVFLAMAGYMHALHDYHDCISASGPF